ncbi:hypothetical protein L7F22_063911 [Adiantum nelumboides]|nr:hypothetical protein [Adiantum nelumboides]
MCFGGRGGGPPRQPGVGDEDIAGDKKSKTNAHNMSNLVIGAIVSGLALAGWEEEAGSVLTNTSGQELRRRAAGGRALQQAGVHAATMLNGMYMRNLPVYFVEISLNRYAKYLLMDTASSFSWLQCQPCEPNCFEQIGLPIFDPATSRTARMISCQDPLICADVPGRTSPLDGPPTSRCTFDYRLPFHDTQAVGELVTDNFYMTVSGTSIPNIPFGCSFNSPQFKFKPGAGVLALGRGPLSFPSQLHSNGYPSTFSLCFATMFERHDYTSFPPPQLRFGSPVSGDTIFTPLLPNPSPDPQLRGYYYVQLLGISVNGQPLANIPSYLFSIDPNTGGGGVRFDTAAHLTWLPVLVYQALFETVQNFMALNALHFRLDEEVYATNLLCYQPLQVNPMIFFEQRYVGVPTVTFHFAGGANLVVPPYNVIVPMNHVGLRYDTYHRQGFPHCLAFTKSESTDTIIGVSQMRRFLFTFDGQNNRLGFSPRPAC